MKLKDTFKYYAKVATNKLGWVAGQIELTTKCFQHCRGCVSWQQEMKEWTFDQLTNMHSQLSKFPTFEHLTLTGGDPQAWPRLNEFLMYHAAQKSKPKLQINCALARNIKNTNLWRAAIDDIKVSMDAYSNKMFQLMRGDKENTPKTILERCWQLKHPRLAFNITVYPANQCELVGLIRWLNSHYEQGLPIRKIMITAGIGGKEGVNIQNKRFWSQWREDKNFILRDKDITVKTSFHELADEDEGMVRDICNTPEIENVHCWASMLGFHIKPNGDLYPCCIVGGEVAETLEEFKIGNVFEEDLKTLYAKLTPQLHYKKAVCRENCMYKQLQLNTICEEASKTVLSLP